MKSMSELAAIVNGVLQGQDRPFSGISTDSRRIQAGNVFVALRGEKFDGHEYVGQVEKLGAVAAVVDHYVEGTQLTQIIVADTTKAFGSIGAAYRNQFKGPVIGVTGSGGKTTVKGMLHHILKRQGSTLASQGNFNNQIGVPLTLMELAKQQYAVVEMGTNHPGEIGYLTSLVRPDVALVNNVMPAHIGGFGSLEAIAEEKSEIYSLLTDSQLAVVNMDDQFALRFLDKTRYCRQLLFAVEPEQAEFSGLVAENLHADDTGCFRFQLRNEHDSVDVALAVLGRHMVNNALAAAACAFAIGFSLQDISLGLATYRGEKSRMQPLSGIRGSRIIDDGYNANPGSVRAAIDFLISTHSKTILVLGDLGELGETALEAHKQIGEYAKQKGIDALYAVGEAATLAAKSFGEGGLSFSSKEDLSKHLILHLDSNTTVLVKGSRSAKMEDVCQALLEKTEGANPC